MSATPGTDEADKHARDERRKGWLLVVIGLLIPILAFVGAFTGWQLYESGRRSEGLPLVIVGLLIGVVRLVLFARTGFKSAW